MLFRDAFSRFPLSVALLVLEFTSASAGEASAIRPFTVTDSIGMTKIVDPAPSFRFGVSHEFNRSPDGRRFVVVLRRGHLDTDEVEYELVLFDTDDVLAAVNAGTVRLCDVLLTFRTSSGKHAIDTVKWRDNDTLTFIGRTGEQPDQVYSFDLRTRYLRKLTNRSGGIYSYDVASTGALVYSAPVFPDWRERNRRGYVVGETIIDNLTITDPKEAILQDLAFFAEDLNSGAASRLDVGLNWIPTAFGSLVLPTEIAISPDGRWAILLATPRSRPPATWAEYTFLQEYLSHFPKSQDPQAALEALVPVEALAPRAGTMKQFFLADLAHGTVRPLLDAPAFGWGTFIRWSTDSRRVALAPTYMPLDVAEGEELSRRRAAPALVEVEVPSGVFARITDRVRSISKLDWLRGGDVRVEGTGEQGAAPLVAQFRKRGQVWVEVQPGRTPAQRLELRVQEDMNTPPQIVAIDRKTGKEGAITDLNPQLQALALGHVEVFEWRDRLNRRYRGGLVLPPGFRKDQRYPVVLQTYGFNPDEFLVDAPQGMSTAYAARALASKDILVLQMPEGNVADPGPATQDLTWQYDRDGENPRFIAMMEGAIDALSERGVIDRDRVGLVGFSRAGMHVQYAITFSGYPIAAATIAHSVQATPFAYVLSYGIPYPSGSLAFEDIDQIGAPFWGDGIKSWMERSPAFHLDKIRTPLRLEHLTTNVPQYWDTFVGLKRHQRPVEMIHIPVAEHLLERPLARYTSQQGNVDWFAFWLKGEEDPDPAKAAQYERWRILRRQHQAHLARTSKE